MVSLCLTFSMVNLFDTFQTNFVINFHNKIRQTNSFFLVYVLQPQFYIKHKFKFIKFLNHCHGKK